MNLKDLLLLRDDDVIPALHTKYEGCDTTKDYLYVPGSGPILLQAHVDTMRRGNKIPKMYTRNGIIYADDILGSDDRAGCYAITQVATPDVSLLFTHGEESGGTGMIEFLKEKWDFSHIKLAIALDRQGVSEFVTYNGLHDNIRKWAKSFGYKEENGSFSDIALFTDKTKIPSINLSVGYHRAHTKDEYLCVDELLLTIGRLKTMLKNPITKLYKSKKAKWDMSYKGYGWSYPSKGYYNHKPVISDGIDYCELCGDHGIGWIKDDADGWYYVCAACAQGRHHYLTQAQMMY